MKDCHPTSQLIGALDPPYNNSEGAHQPISNIRLLHYAAMGTQFSHGRARPRLQSEGRTHWFDGTILPHPRNDLAQLFERAYSDELAAGRTLVDYRNRARFGPLVKESERRHQGNRLTRPGLYGHVSSLLRS